MCSFDNACLYSSNDNTSTDNGEERIFCKNFVGIYLFIKISFLTEYFKPFCKQSTCVKNNSETCFSVLRPTFYLFMFLLLHINKHYKLKKLYHAFIMI